MDDKYNIDGLIKIFTIHANTFQKQCEERSGWDKDSFNLSKALLSICEEIKSLNNHIGKDA